MTATVVRDDLSKRTALSKSALVGFDICQTQAWFDIHEREPLIPQERITFGSAVDAAVEAAIAYVRMSQPIDEPRCMAAATEIILRDEVPVSLDEIEHALLRFVVEVAPNYDLSHARLQHHIKGTLEDLGEVDGYPDVWLPGVAIIDVKTSARAKKDEPTVELGFYALLAQEVESEPVPEVGYWTWVRVAKPYWQRLSFPVTDELLRWTVEAAASYVRAKRADQVLNAKAETPHNWSMTGGPKYGPSSCVTCQYASRCPRAWKGDTDDAA